MKNKLKALNYICKTQFHLFDLNSLDFKFSFNEEQQINFKEEKRRGKIKKNEIKRKDRKEEKKQFLKLWNSINILYTVLEHI